MPNAGVMNMGIKEGISGAFLREGSSKDTICFVHSVERVDKCRQDVGAAIESKQ